MLGCKGCDHLLCENACLAEHESSAKYCIDTVENAGTACRQNCWTDYKCIEDCHKTQMDEMKICPCADLCPGFKKLRIIRSLQFV